MNKKHNDLISLVSVPGESTIDWDRIIQSELRPYLQAMSETPQNPEWHGEGDVLTHTKMVCESLINSKSWRNLERNRQEELFIAALLHDIGKPKCTRVENNVIVSPNHASTGERLARTILWRDYDLCGTAEAQQFRENVCYLIKKHTVPFSLRYDKSPEYTAIKTSAGGALISRFSNELLCTLAEADAKGRIANDTEENLIYLELFRETAKDAGCFEKPKDFPSPFSRYAYLSGRNVFPGQELYDDTWGTVVIMSGLPGTGKDTYIQAHYPDIPMISLDTLRKEMKIPHKKPQGEVVDAARKQAREYLRKKQPFVWNATNITPALREKQIDLFMGYKASVKIVYLETRWDEMLRRNQNRPDVVPESVIEEMLRKLTPPNLCETHEVEWVVV